MASQPQNPSKKALRTPGGSGSQSSRTNQTVKFARRTSSGRYVSLSREDIDISGEISGDYMNYTVHIPPTPDNQPMNEPMEASSVALKAEEQYVSNSLFTGGFNTVTRAHLMDKMAAGKGSLCSMAACDGKVMTDENGDDLDPCECRFKICRDCYMDAQKGGGMCPGCKEPYKVGEYDDGDPPEFSAGAALPLPAPASQKTDRRMSVMKSTNKSLLMRSQTGEFDHNRWLFETKGTYGYGNAFWAKDDGYGGAGAGEDDSDFSGPPPEAMDKQWKPLTRKIPMPTAIISPYRLLIAVRIVALGFFLQWRVKHPNEEALWLWGMSIVCELWFAFSWLLDQIPKLCPINRATDLAVLRDKFDSPSPANPAGRSDLPGVDVFVSTADPEKEPPLVTANTILSILAVDYPVEKLACYVSDDGGALLTFEAMAEAASFAAIWVPFCRKHDIEPRNPDSYFNVKGDPTKNKRRSDFVKDRRRIKREYDEFKVRINGLPDSIRRRSDAFNAREEMKMLKMMREKGADPSEPIKVQKATWMADGTHWPATWAVSAADHGKGDHPSVLQVMLRPPAPEPVMGPPEEERMMDFSDVDVRLPMLVYMSREKRRGYDHNKKAGAMNALVRSSAVLSNGAFILNLDCDHYVYNSQAIREGMCFMMDRGGDRICYIQFPQRFEGIDPSDRYANHNTVFFDGNMRALDGVQVTNPNPSSSSSSSTSTTTTTIFFFSPMVLGSSLRRGRCTSARGASSGASLSTASTRRGRRNQTSSKKTAWRWPSFRRASETPPPSPSPSPSPSFRAAPSPTTPASRTAPPGALRVPREPLDSSVVTEAVSVISCWYEDKTEWGSRIGWIYGSVTEDVVTGYRMHNRGWRSVYCITKRDAFRGSAPINLTDRLHQVLRWATGSVEIFFSRNNALLASSRLKLLQRIAYLNVGIYPFTSMFLIMYCFIPALSLFSGHFIVQSLDVTFLVYLLIITITLTLLAILEVKWSGVGLEEWWRNEQFWLISGTSAHLAAVVQGLLKVIAGIEISFTLTSKSAGEDVEDAFAELYIVKWTSLMIPPITIMMVNIIAIAVGFSRTIYSETPQWSKLMGGLLQLLGACSSEGKTPTIVFVWSGLIAITISLLWIAINPQGLCNSRRSSGFQFP
ncbi:unnamed protein product [Spirodela intermedia]|uniref:Uncharacterized protein n=1 Tax=Spirodela intermedia TaxID=51605 RepID=A0A7I8JS97_SPIIN|nr:unnamed protein product [Spirodela intermedia]CAA6672302.1 unnamed protein product [Spirodela intermedia]